MPPPSPPKKAKLFLTKVEPLYQIIKAGIIFIMLHCCKHTQDIYDLCFSF